MQQSTINTALPSGITRETLWGIVDRVTFHSVDTGYSVLRVHINGNPQQQETIIVHQMQVFAGATIEFTGSWETHSKHGRQFNAVSAVEKQPASIAALEKYLGSGLIRGVGPKTAKRIVQHFGHQTLEIFENHIEALTDVPGIAEKKLSTISRAWADHRTIRNVMMFLQSHGISTLFSVRIYKEYGDTAIEKVRSNPYCLSDDFYGIGFFSADKVALSIGLAPDSRERIMAGIGHVLSAGKQFGHCYLTMAQIEKQVEELLTQDIRDRLTSILAEMTKTNLLRVRYFTDTEGNTVTCYYSKSLYYDEIRVAEKIRSMNHPVEVDMQRVEAWMERYCNSQQMNLSPQQASAIKHIVSCQFSVLTGGPGCGKTTATRVLVKLLEAMGKKILLAAPTGRAAQRMTEVIGRKSKTIHRLLTWQAGQFKKNEQSPIDADFLIADECSMLDINLGASLLRAVPGKCQVLFIGDADQLPSVGPGNVLKDIIASGSVHCFRLTTIFRQAKESLIIRHAHTVNTGKIPRIDSPFKNPGIWRQKDDCLFIDTEEATGDQIKFISRVKKIVDAYVEITAQHSDDPPDPYEFGADGTTSPLNPEIVIPKQFRHVNLEEIYTATNRVEELMAVLKKVHPWSSLHYGLSAVDVVKKTYMEWIPRYHGKGCEIQVLSPMTRGTLGTINLNRVLQESANPQKPGKRQLIMGDRIFREGDRVIHRRNNYELKVFNGDIGKITRIDSGTMNCTVSFFPGNRRVLYQRENLLELDLAYAITIHKSQGSEFEAVIFPLLTQHFKMLYKNLIYTGLTRAKKLAVFVGTRRALALATKKEDTSMRQTMLGQLLNDRI